MYDKLNKTRKDVRRDRARRFSRRLRRAIAIILLVLLAPAGVSYVSALTKPGNTSIAIRTVEWLRDEHAGFIVATAENLWYTAVQPPTGGPPLSVLPARAPATPDASRKAPITKQGLPFPKNIRPAVSPALPGEGIWMPAGQVINGRAPILETILRPDPIRPTVVAGLAWIDTSRTHLTLVPGLSEPESNLPPGRAEVPLKDRSRLLATFNGGFKTKDGHGGFIAGGKTYVSPKAGLASVAVYRNGHVELGSWGSEIKPSSHIVYLRQNLPLIVDHGTLNPQINNSLAWGTTVGNGVRIWRSGLGIDAHGGLIYAASNGVSARGLADLLIQAGAVRAMELDINSYWPDFFTYSAPGGKAPSKLLPLMQRPMNRYLVPDSRDFFVVTR